MPEFTQRSGGFYFAVWLEKDGRLVERSESLGGAALPRFAGPDGRAEFREFALRTGDAVRAIGQRVPFLADDEAKGEAGKANESPIPARPGAVIVVAGETQALADRLRSLALEMTASGALGLAAIAFLVSTILRRGLTPLVRISEFAAQLDPEHLEARFPEAGLPAELSPIAARLNDLFARLEKAFADERRFSADVAHELRTPVSELTTLATVGETIVPPDSESSAFFRDAGAIARRMHRTISDLMLMARCESGHQPAQREEVNLGQLLKALCAAAEAAIRARSIRFENGIPSYLTWRSDGDLLARLFGILVENAVEYTSSPGKITLGADDHGIFITNGPVTLTSSDLPHLFKRFWRKDPARSGETHAGLGLGLAAEIAGVLGIRLLPRLDGNEVTFRVCTPAFEKPDGLLPILRDPN